MDAFYPVVTLEDLSGELNSNVDKIELKLIKDKLDPTNISYAVATAEKIAEHATNYRENFFDGVRVREDMLRYLHFYSIGEDETPKYGNQDELSAMLDANLWSERQDDEAKIAELIKYSSINKETEYIIGFVLITKQVLEYVTENIKNVVLTLESPFDQVLRANRFSKLLGLLIEDYSGILKKINKKS